MNAKTNRSALLAFFIGCLCCSATRADEYFLHVDTVGFVDRLSSEKQPKETTFRSVEVLVRANLPFHSKVKTAKQTLIVTGLLQPARAGEFELQIRYSCSNGGGSSFIGHSEIQTKIAISVGDTVTLGGLESKSKKPNALERKSATRCVCRLVEYTPDAE